MRPPERSAPPARPQNAQQAIAAQAAAKRQAAANAGGKPSGNYGAGNARPTPQARAFHNTAAQTAAARGTQSSAVSDDIFAIMAQSGSQDPSDPYNWRGIAAALAAQEPASRSSDMGYVPPPQTPNIAGAGAAPTPAITPVYETPVSYVAPSVAAPARGVTAEASGAVGAPSGESFNAFGGGLTAGLFERMRNQRSPRTGLSVTPEMLMAQARKRLG